MVIKMKDESDFRNWFKQNYRKLGFSEIICSNTLKCPDFIMLKNGKEEKIELETKSSNFNLHNHLINEVDKVICIIKDAKLSIPIIKVNGIELVDFREKNLFYSTKMQIYHLLTESPRGLTIQDIAKSLKISRNTVAIAIAGLEGAEKIEIRQIGKAKLIYSKI